MLNYSSSLFSIHVVYVVFLLRAKLQNTQSQLCNVQSTSMAEHLCNKPLAIFLHVFNSGLALVHLYDK